MDRSMSLCLRADKPGKMVVGVDRWLPDVENELPIIL